MHISLFYHIDTNFRKQGDDFENNFKKYHSVFIICVYIIIKILIYKTEPMKRQFLLFCILAVLLLCNCMDAPPLLMQQSEKQRTSFKTDEAKKFFEEKATVFRQLSFDSPTKLQTRSGSSSENMLTPQWERAKESSNAEVSLVEIPILSTQTTVVKGDWHFPSGTVISTNVITNQKLIIAQRNNGVIQTFVITLIPDYNYQSNTVDFTKNFSYLGGGNFSGTVLCSNLNGGLIDAYAYKNGHKIQALYVIPKEELLQNEVLPENAKYMTFKLMNYNQLANANYNPAECIHGLDTAACSECLPEVVVIARCLVCDGKGTDCGCCQKCKTWFYENCLHKPCVWCMNHPCTCIDICMVCLNGPCTCTYCTKCHRVGCFGECDQYEDKPIRPVCPYGKCRMDPCICCPTCFGPCKCPWRICHHTPCICCYFCYGPCRCPIGKCHEFPCVCPCYDLSKNEADPFKDATISEDNQSWKKNVFGMTRDNGSGPGTKLHDGIDLIGQSGVTPVQTMFPGKVTRVVSGQPNKILNEITGKPEYPLGYSGDRNDAGNRITISSDLPDGTKIETSYWHLDVKANNPYTQKLKVGDNIQQGQAIGVIGYTGNSNKDFPHLHLKTAIPGKTKNDSLNNPEKYLYTKFDPKTGKVNRNCNTNH